MATTFVDQITGGGETVAYKAPCRLATTANIVLSGLQAIDGSLSLADDRVFVRAQTDASANGIYIASAGLWQRARDFDSNRDVTKGTRLTVTDGATAAGREYILTSANPIVVGTSDITFSELPAGDFAGPGASVANNLVTFSDTSGKVGKDSGVAISSLAPKASPGLTGTPTAPTAAPGTNTTQIASTAFVRAAVDVVLGGVSSAFDTLSEIATAIGLLAPKASPALTGTPTAPTASGGTNTTQLATTAFVTAAVTAAAPNYGTGNAALAYGSVGSFIWGFILNAGVVEGSTYAGSSIQPAGIAESNVVTSDPGDDVAYGSGTAGVLTKGGSSLSGTWRALGRCNFVNGTVRRRTTLFVRIT